MSRLRGENPLYLIPILLCLFMACPGIAGAAEIPGGTQADGDWLIRRMPAEPATLNPVTATDVYEGMVNGYIYESLLKRDNRTLELVPLLAETFEASSDHLNYTFTLRKGLRW